jgi:hypothetical protein
MIERREIVAGTDITQAKLHRLIADSIRAG